MTNGQWLEKKFEELLKWSREHSLWLGFLLVIIGGIGVFLLVKDKEVGIVLVLMSMFVSPTFFAISINNWMNKEHKED